MICEEGSIPATKEETVVNLQVVEDGKTSQEQQATTGTESCDANTEQIHMTNSRGLFRTQFQQKTRLVRQLLSQQQQRIKENQDSTQLITIIILSILAIGCSIGAVLTNSWYCDPMNRFGLWNTCFSVNRELQSDTNSSVTVTLPEKMCARQEMGQVLIGFAEQSRIDQVTAAQGLIIGGSILYALSILSNCFGCRFIQMKNLNSLRNMLVVGMFLQILSFIFHIVGFFLFILTDHLSTSVTLLFIYFGIAIFGTNIINFITIEYKCYKYRHHV
jgi:hypothetical protein